MLCVFKNKYRTWKQHFRLQILLEVDSHSPLCPGPLVPTEPQHVPKSYADILPRQMDA